MKKIDRLTTNLIVVNKRLKETVNDKRMNDRWLHVYNQLTSALLNELADPSEKGIINGVQVL